MHSMTNYGKLFSDELTEWLVEVGFIKSQCKMSIYYKYAPDGSKIIVSFYIVDCVYWYNYKALGKWFVETTGNRLHVNLLGYAHWLM